MAGVFSVKINKKEGLLEVVGEDKEWVDKKLSEYSGVHENFVPAPEPESFILPNSQKPTVTKKPKQSSRGKSSSTPSKPQTNFELRDKLTSDVTAKLQKYVEDRNAEFEKSQPAQAAILATFLQDELQWVGVDHHDLYTVYNHMGFPPPISISSQLKNAKQRNQYFSGMEEGKYRLSAKGERYAHHDSLNK